MHTNNARPPECTQSPPPAWQPEAAAPAACHAFAAGPAGLAVFFSEVPMDKATERLTVLIGEDLKVDLMHLAAAADRPLGEYIRHVLLCHAYGYRELQRHGCEDAKGGGAPR